MEAHGHVLEPFRALAVDALPPPGVINDPDVNA